jgi:hypothetical protein
MEQLKQPIDRIEVKGIKDQELDNILIWAFGWDIDIESRLGSKITDIIYDNKGFCLFNSQERKLTFISYQRRPRCGGKRRFEVYEGEKYLGEIYVIYTADHGSACAYAPHYYYEGMFIFQAFKLEEDKIVELKEEERDKILEILMERERKRREKEQFEEDEKFYYINY